MNATTIDDFARKGKELERKLKHNETRLKQAQAIAHIGSWEYDLSTGICELSDETCRIYGLDLSDNLHTYESLLSFIHAAEQEEVAGIMNEAFRDIINFAFTHRIVHEDGTIRHLYTKGNFEFDDHGNPVCIFGIAHDITETKNAELALATSEANLRLIVDLVPQGIFAKDKNGRFTFANKAFAALHGLTPEDVLTKTVADIITFKEEENIFSQQDRKVIASNRTVHVAENVLTDRQGNKRYFETTKVPFTTISGNSEISVLGIIKEVTEQKQVEGERAKMIAEILHRNKILEQFTYIVSHNLRAPVANILGMTELLQTEMLDRIEERTFIRELGTAANKLDNVVMDLNAILQVDRKENMAKELVRFSELADDIKIDFATLLQKEKIQVIYDFSAANELLTLKGYLRSILFNLISNSIKYRRPNEPSVIELWSVIKENKLQIYVRDNGLGIDLQHNADKIFGLYKRFHPLIDGKGMGLFMVKTQVELLGGHIHVASEVNMGTEFCIEFELA